MKPTFVLLIGLLLSTSSLLAQEFNREKMDSLFSKIEAKDQGMGSIAISKAGKTVYQRATGYQDVARKSSATPATVYGIGSISKIFTAVIVLQQVEANKLELSTTLDNFFPELPNADSITIEHLLRHRSGLYNFTDEAAYPAKMEQAMTKEQLLEWFAELGTDFPPGEQMSYSNTGYVLLSFIVEEVSGKPYAELLEEGIAKTCGLESTYMPSEVVGSREGEALSYSRGEEQWEQATRTHPSIPTGAGAILSTPNDLNQFLHCLFSGKLLEQEMVDQMMEMKDGHGLGLVQFPFYDKTAYGHNGSIDGFASSAGYFVEEDVAVSYISNGLVMSVNDIMLGALSIYFGKPYDMPEFKPAIELEAEVLDTYVGVYTSTELPMSITISRDGDMLMAQASGQSPFPLEAYGERLFRFTRAGIKIEFLPEKGQLALRQSGSTYTFSKE
jgi:D-alanyl-D-alanine carboxypeptidase